MLTHRGFSAWIVVDGKPVPEYLAAANHQTNQMSCWIESEEEGKAFSVHWTDHGGKVDTCAFIILDGVVCPGRFLFGSGTTCREGVRTSKNTERPFVFKRAQDNLASSPSSHPKEAAGMITLKIKRVERVSHRPANDIPNLSTIYPNPRKPGDVCATFGEDTQAYEQAPYTWAIRPHDQSPSSDSKKLSTYVSFTFRYRPREFLQSEGILSAPHSSPVNSAPSIPPNLPLNLIPSLPSTPSSFSRDPTRRIVSAPVSRAPPTPSPTPPMRHESPRSYSPLGPYPLHRPTVETRRTASWRNMPTSSTESSPLSPLVTLPVTFTMPLGHSPDALSSRYASESDFSGGSQ